MNYQPGNPILDAIRARGEHTNEHSRKLLEEHRRMQSEKWELIRRFYAEVDSEIRISASRWAFDDPYCWAEPLQSVVMTPIESLLWCDIRQAGAVLYPQYPVGRYFVDFGNPVAQVAVECDGKLYHSNPEQLARDARRQADIEAMGWKVFRLTGSECTRDTLEVQDRDTGVITRTPSKAAALIAKLVRDFRIGAQR